ncbi:Na+/H+ antiporter subunit E [Roseicella aquatilis]|uniref:Na+/H+ antiporter subunit E n=1 Tax=Roseicella aquatilis TaxID=2527868 RepID=A0A4R4DFK0_9PROT|nr:Na+/H+ antiporter subunit E [Roseicella aquatilis]TCZ59667.1 Na+/H+ antiporter subunit E [Roseicella aquatilis]
MTRWLPYPLFTLGLLVLWLLLTESTAPGSLLLGTVLALAGSGTLAALTPPKARLRRLSIVPGLLRDVLVEVVRSNNAVAWIILQPRRLRGYRSGFVLVPLDMRSPYGLAALACIVTATPGTVWVEYDSARSTMLLHVLDLIDEEAWIRIIKGKWERRLMEIFE